jgi:adenosylmethionine-8-amino-7-oxononanoate aminotransferase
MAFYDPLYLREARALCDAHQVLLIADEIAVGFGRTGTFFAFEQTALDGQAPIWPDLLCLSKGITGGYLPLAVVLSTEAIYAAFLDDDVTRGFLHSHSYSGNALACRAALAVLDRFRDDAVLENNAKQAGTLTEALAPLTDDPRIAHLRHLGMIWAFDVDEAFAGPSFSERFHLAGRSHGLLIRPIGRTVYLMPPYVLESSLSRWLAEQVRATLEDVLQAPNPDAHRLSEPAIA